MREKIRKYIIREAKVYGHDISGDLLLGELANNSEEYYDTLVNSGMAPQKALETVLSSLGDLSSYFQDNYLPGEQRARKFNLIDHFIDLFVVMTACLAALLYYPVQHDLLIIFSECLVIGAAVLGKYYLYSRQILLRRERRQRTHRSLFFILVNLTILISLFLDLPQDHYLDLAGILGLVFNIFYVLLISKKGSKLLLLTASLGLMSATAIWGSREDWFIIIIIAVSSFGIMSYLLTKMKSLDKYDLALIAFSLLVNLLNFLIHFNDWILYLILIGLILITAVIYLRRPIDREEKIDKCSKFITIVIMIQVLRAYLICFVLYFDISHQFRHYMIKDMVFLYKYLIWIAAIEFINLIFSYCLHKCTFKKKLKKIGEITNEKDYIGALDRIGLNR